MRKRPQWEVRFYLDTNLYHASYTLVGLQQLAEQGVVRLQECGNRQSPLRGQQHEWYGVNLEVRPFGHDRWRLITYDYQDANWNVCRASLELSEIYWKASYYLPYLQELAPDLVHRVRPAGLHMGIRPYSQPYRLIPTALKTSVGALDRGRDGQMYVIRKLLSCLKHRATIQEYEAGRNTQRKPRQVFFNPGTWNEKKYRELNELRAGLIRTLRAGDRWDFVGGFRPTPLAQRRYADLIFGENPNHREYLRLVAESAVVIDIVGTDNCHSWRLSEYLAAGKCILAERNMNELPQPLRDGEELMWFDTDLSDFVPKLTQVIESAELRAHLENGARRYYDEWVKPVVATRRLLQESTADM